MSDVVVNGICGCHVTRLVPLQKSSHFASPHDMSWKEFETDMEFSSTVKCEQDLERLYDN